MGLFSKMRERRQYPRHIKELSVHIKNRAHKVAGRLKKSDAGRDSQTAVGKDISLGGLCFYSKIAYEPDTRLEMTIRILDFKNEAGYTPMHLKTSSVPVRAEGQVIWNKAVGDGGGYEVGVEFTEIYEDDYKILQKNLKD